MGWWLETSVVCIVAIALWDLYLNYRQLQRHIQDKEVPVKLQGLVTDEEFAECNAYQKDHLILRMVQTSFDLCLTTWFIVARVYPLIWITVEYYLGENTHEFWKSLGFMAINYTINEVVSLPFSLYSDFVVEEKHGFNKKTWKIFVKDMALSAGLVAVIGAPVMAIVIKLVHWAGPSCWIWIWFFMLAFSIAMTFIAPVLIFPLFNKYDPIEDEELRHKIEDLARSVDYPLSKMYQMDGSKRSSHSNAFQYGFWKNKRVVLFDTLLKSDHREILAILAHEFGHWKFNHMLKTLALSSVVMLIQLFLFRLIVFREEPFQDFGFSESSVVAGLFILSLILSPIATVLSVGSNMLSRHHEYQADGYAKSLGMGRDLGLSLIHIFDSNKGTLNPDPLYATCKYSHPSLIERLEALEYFEKKE